jgi:hypothetical protein
MKPKTGPARIPSERNDREFRRMPDQMVKRYKESAGPPASAESDKLTADEEALVTLFRALSAENRLNMLRYAEATRDIQSIFRAGSKPGH